jgi:hypothetical protein
MKLLTRLARKLRDFLIFPVVGRHHDSAAAAQIYLKLAYKQSAH